MVSVRSHPEWVRGLKLGGLLGFGGSKCRTPSGCVD